ncbi:MAG TPA: tetratricopeptide repeat protein [Candidatus Binataceae bacterium]|nr:tetratricopeptide repeat protein [Candidatus Binataceae bacterium]
MTAAIANDDQVCDATADYFLGVEDYPEAVKSHLRVISAHPNDALAHYHLGFAYGMLGRRDDELVEYRRAINLGLRKWDLFVNLGRLYLENGEFAAGTGAFATAAALGPLHAEAHYNLALAYERQGSLEAARQEMLTSLRLDPAQVDASNMLGLIYAEQGDFARARQVWRDLARAHPDFEAPRANLAVLERTGGPPKTQISALPSDSRNAILRVAR